MDEAGEADVGEVAGGTEYAFEVPDGFGAKGRLGSALNLGGWPRGRRKEELTLQDRFRRGIRRRYSCRTRQ